MLQERIEKNWVTEAGFQIHLDPVSNATCLSPPRTDKGEAHCTCAVGHCGLYKELHCVLDPQRSPTAFSWEDPRDQVLVSQQHPSLIRQPQIKVLTPVPQPETPGSFQAVSAVPWVSYTVCQDAWFYTSNSQVQNEASSLLLPNGPLTPCH